LTLNWENKVTEMTLLYSDADFNERITFTTNGPGSTMSATLVGPTDSWTPPNSLSGSGNDRNDDPKDFSIVLIKDPAGFTQLNLIHGHIRPIGVNGILQLKARPMAPAGGECPVETTTTTTTTTEAPQCEEVAVDWVAQGGFQAPADNGRACFNAKRGWRNWVCSDKAKKYCGNRRWENDVTSCCPGICSPAPANVFNEKLGKVTWQGVGPLGRGAPVFGSAASQPALLFWNKQHKLVLNWENKVTEMTLLYSDADFNEKITFTTNGAGSTFRAASIGPTDTWTAPNVLSGSGNDRNDDPQDFSSIVIKDPAGFNQLTLAHGYIRPTGVNGILQLKARPMGFPNCP